MRPLARHIAVCALILACAPVARAAEGCAAFLADIRFCAESIGLDLAAQDDLEGGGFLNAADPEGTIVYVYVVPTALPVPDNPADRLELMDSGYLVEAAPGEDRQILASRVVPGQPLTTLHSVRFSRTADDARVFALTSVLLDGLVVTVMTVDPSDTPMQTEAHRARHAAAILALRFPQTDTGCHPMQVGLQLCTTGTPWAGLTPFYIDNGLALTDLDNSDRDLLVSYGSGADPDREFTAQFVSDTNRRLAAAELADITFSADTTARTGGRLWQVVDYAAETSNDTDVAGRSSLAIGNGVFTLVRTSRTGIPADPLPQDLIAAHDTVRASLELRPGGDAAWIRLEGAN